jgi:hypothetical protein
VDTGFVVRFYKESKRTWLIKQHTKELKGRRRRRRRRRTEEERNGTNERNYGSNRE